jgi:hypothetical protein
VSEFGLPEYMPPPDPEFWAEMAAGWASHARFCREVATLHAALGLDSAVDYDTGVIVSEAEAIACDMKRRRDLRRVAVSENA